MKLASSRANCVFASPQPRSCSVIFTQKLITCRAFPTFLFLFAFRNPFFTRLLQTAQRIEKFRIATYTVNHARRNLKKHWKHRRNFFSFAKPKNHRSNKYTQTSGTSGGKVWALISVRWGGKKFVLAQKFIFFRKKASLVGTRNERTFMFLRLCMNCREERTFSKFYFSFRVILFAWNVLVVGAANICVCVVAFGCLCRRFFVSTDSFLRDVKIGLRDDHPAFYSGYFGSNCRWITAVIRYIIQTMLEKFLNFISP